MTETSCRGQVTAINVCRRYERPVPGASGKECQVELQLGKLKRST